MKKKLFLSAWICAVCLSMHAQNQPEGGATEQTPSYSEFFSWINNTNEGATDAQTRVNLNFFRWLHDTYGMTLDIYAFDAGAIDGSKMYGSMDSPRFKRQFPEGFDALSKLSNEMGTRLGLWCGPDGFGDTEEEAQAREEMMVSLARDYNFGLFKMDAVCGPLRPSKYEIFDRMMTRVREYCPNFVLLNHRLDLGPGTRHSTTYLLGGAETYIDVHMGNNGTATHHRAIALERKAPENLTRLTEDHGVCLSSCMDYWEDDLILQAFGRELILAPELYANPWLLRDDEFPQLAYIFNLHRRYRNILPSALRLDEKQYGPEALSRGTEKTRFLTLRNLTWNPVTYKIRLGEETGLAKSGGKVQVRQYHPYIYDMGRHSYGEEVEVEVLPFRTALVKLTTEAERDPLLVSGIPYQIVNDSENGLQEVKLLGWPGETYKVKIGKQGVQTVTFPGTPLREKFHREVAKMDKCEVPDDARSLYLATCYAADNNALEVRSLLRSGGTVIPQVQAAREAFFHQRQFVERDLWDRNLFDNNTSTGFAIAQRWGDQRVGNRSSLYLDLGKETELDELRWTANTEYDLTPLRTAEGMNVQVSTNLKDWTSIVALADKNMTVNLHGKGAVRYVKFPICPLRLTEIEGYKDGVKVDNSLWRANNLFLNDGECHFKQAWKGEFSLPEIPTGAYLCIAVPGTHGREGAWAALKIDGKYVGCPDRAPSYESNTWECPVCDREANYTFYVPLTAEMKGKKIEAWVLGKNEEPLQPEVWITAYPIPFEQKTITLKK